MTLATIPFGTLESVDLRSAWTREDTHFTPWLAQKANLRLLSDAIGMDLELQGQEQDVGPFRADLLCKATADGTFVLIENQIERTDHTHLGQLITYAAGLDAVTIVWIAAHFSEEHRAALDWLNEVSHENIQFFGLEVELWRIGSSPVAPKFNVVAKPNGWSKQVRDAATGGATSEHRAFRQRFWKGFLEHLAANKSSLSYNRQPQMDHWMDWGIGSTAARLSASVGFRDGYLDASLVVFDHDLFRRIEATKEELHRALGEPLVWDFVESRKSSFARLRTEDVDPMNETDWPKQYAWLRTKLELLERVVKPRVAELTR